MKREFFDPNKEVMKILVFFIVHAVDDEMVISHNCPIKTPIVYALLGTKQANHLREKKTDITCYSGLAL
jgi:hypothetical protein